MAKFRKRPVTVEAVQFVAHHLPFPGRCDCSDKPLPHIHTLEGVMVPDLCDWIITGVKGEHYPCKPDIFDMTYEPVVTPPEGRP